MVAGTVEYLTEKIPVNNLFKMLDSGAGGFTRGLINVAEQAGLGGAQAYVSSYAGVLSDQLIMQDRSQLNSLIVENQRNGMSYDDAVRAAVVKLYVTDPLTAAGQGAAMGAAVALPFALHGGNTAAPNGYLGSKAPEAGLAQKNVPSIAEETVSAYRKQWPNAKGETIESDLEKVYNNIYGKGGRTESSTEGAGDLWESTDNLIKSATMPGKGGVSPVGRAFQKHAGNPSRAGTFVGEVSGNATRNTEQGAQYISDILSNPQSTYKVRHTDAFGDILDVRLPDGTGARWSADGKTFIGFLEKYTK
ncbi:hypothetical protein SAMN02745823_03884 [Sporobacter termitidis DSM 10068]|uniref:Filamentous hemagglutinin n=2 Tax=Sporobacter TaxID=44748 RepID=A0A1M5ZLB6_9FIRM|nr:hypothetical protein SAMN02745823_03884 [Sporobacter termitidis DSM 10068]